MAKLALALLAVAITSVRSDSPAPWNLTTACTAEYDPYNIGGGGGCAVMEQFVIAYSTAVNDPTIGNSCGDLYYHMKILCGCVARHRTLHEGQP